MTEYFSYENDGEPTMILGLTIENAENGLRIIAHRNNGDIDIGHFTFMCEPQEFFIDMSNNLMHSLGIIDIE